MAINLSGNGNDLTKLVSLATVSLGLNYLIFSKLLSPKTPSSPTLDNRDIIKETILREKEEIYGL